MPRYRITLDDGRETVEECVDDAAATEYAMELLLDDGAEPGEEAAVYRLAGERGAADHVATVGVPE